MNVKFDGGLNAIVWYNLIVCFFFVFFNVIVLLTLFNEAQKGKSKQSNMEHGLLAN